VRLLPLPAVTFSELSVGQYVDGEAMMTVDSFSMVTELLPFLRGEVRIVDMLLENPVLSVRVNENGTVDWTSRKEMLVNPDNIKIDALRVTNAKIRIEGLAGGRRFVGDSFDAEISAQSLYGPWRIDATGSIDGAQTNLDISTGRLQPEGKIRVRVAARRADQPYRLMLDGPLSVEDQVLDWQGQFELTATNDGEGVAGAALPIFASGLFHAMPHRIEAPEYRLEVGDREDPYTVSGAGAINVQEQISFQVTADGRQIDLERLDAPRESASGGLEKRLAALRAVVDRIPIPQIPGEIDFSLPAIVAEDTVIREVSANVRPDINGWDIRGLRAIFPGNTSVEANGKLGTREDFGFTGELVLASRQPTGFAGWLSGRSGAALRRLRSAGIAADVTITRNQATFDNLELALDDASLTGKIQRIAPASGRAAIIADLSGSEIDIDDLQAVYLLTQREDDAASLTNHDLDVSLRAGLLRGGGLEASDVDAHFRVEGGSISIERLRARDFYGARVATTGELDDLLGEASGGFGMEIRAEQAGRLVTLVRQRLGDHPVLAALASDPDLTRDLALDLRLDARPAPNGARGSITATGTMGGTVVSIRDRFDGKFSEWRNVRHDLTVKLDQPTPHVLARQLGLDVAPLEVGGPATLNAELSGQPDQGLAAVIAVHTPDTDLTATGTIWPGSTADAAFTAAGFAVDVTLGSQNIDPWLQFAGYPLPLIAGESPVSLSMSAHRQDGRYRFETIAGQYGGAKFSGNLSLDTDIGPRPRLEGSLTLGLLPAPLIAEFSLGAGSITQFRSGDIGSFGTPVFAGLDGDVEIAAKLADLGGESVATGWTGRLRLVDGAISLPEFGFDWLGGKLAGDVAIKNVDGNVVISSRIRVEGVEIPRLLSMAGFDPSITGMTDGNFTVQGGGRNLRSLIGSLSGNGVLVARECRIGGLTTAGFDTIVQRSDVEGFAISAGSAKRLARAAMLSGSFASPQFSTAFSINRGQAVIRNLHLSNAGGSIALDGVYAFPAGETEISATVSLDAGDETLTGAEPEARFNWQGKPGELALSVDTNALEGYLSLRAFEREQRRVEMLQAKVLENQRLRREVIEAKARHSYRQAERQRQMEELQEIQRKLQEEQRVRDAEATKLTPRPGTAAFDNEGAVSAPADTPGKTGAVDISGGAATASIQPVQTPNPPMPVPAPAPLRAEQPLQADGEPEPIDMPQQRRGLFFNLQRLFENR
jgi:uncharacterized protein involved in outer membrane biogenesis